MEALKDRIPLVEELRSLLREEQEIIKEINYIDGRLQQLEHEYPHLKRLEELLETVSLMREYFTIRLWEVRRKELEERLKEELEKSK
jgi:hypothetical protein